MRGVLSALALALLAPVSATAHDSQAGVYHVGPEHAHSALAAGAFDTVGPRAEYLGHFLHGRVHHGAAHHGGGHLNAEALFPHDGVLFAAPGGAGFIVLVTPNLVNRAAAQATANALAVAYCAQRPGATRVSYGAVKRHARLRLESWSFVGTCR